MNIGLQEKKIRQMLENQGIPSDLVDVKGQIDSSLRLPENIRELSRKAGLNLRKDRRRGRVKSAKWTEKARRSHNRRSKKARRIDSSIRADETFDSSTLTKRELKEWMKNPNRVDIEGIDTFGGY